MTIDQGYMLVVDDNRMNRMMLSRALEQQGHKVASVENGRQALDMLHRQAFDLVLLDVLMPEMDGYAVLEQIKADPALRHLPVIMISALEEMESVVRCIEMGAEDYLPKPFNAVLLRARVSASLDQKRLHDREVEYLRQVQKEKKRADDLLDVVIPIGVALSSEADFDRLLERILVEAKSFCNADAGTLYLRTEDERLEYMIVRYDSLGLALGGSGGQAVTLPPLNLYEEGEANHYHIVTHAALAGEPVAIADAYQTQGFDFAGTQDFDREYGYTSTSFLAVPLKTGENQVIGVLELVNARSPESDQVVPFDPHLQLMIEQLATLAAVALAAYRREQSLHAQIAALRIEIDEARTARQVAEITDTDYFQGLAARVDRLRAGLEGDE